MTRAIIGTVDHLSAFVSGSGEQIISIDGKKFCTVIDLNRFPVVVGCLVEYRTQGARCEILAVQPELIPQPKAETLFPELDELLLDLGAARRQL